MNDDLNASLHRAVDAALAQATPADQMRRVVADRIRTKRRRRPAFVIGSTLGSLALVGGTAFAAVQLIGDEGHPRVPDVIGSTRPERPVATTSPTEAPTEPAPDPVSTLAAADPDALAPQCGAAIDRGVSIPDDGTSRLYLATSTEGEDIAAPGPAVMAVTLENMELSTITGMAQDALTLVLVKDGIVVGRAPDGSPTMEPYELRGAEQLDLQGSLWIEACSADGPPTGHLPAGRYDVWAMRPYTVTARTYLQDDYSQGPLVPVDESYDFRYRLTHLWIDETGQPTQSPYRAAGMPSAIDVRTAMTGVTDASVVWLALPSDDDAAIAAASTATDELGYGDALWPFMCQGAAGDTFGPDETGRSGVALVFATRTEAERFVELYPGDVAGIVDGDVFCHFD